MCIFHITNFHPITDAYSRNGKMPERTLLKNISQLFFCWYPIPMLSSRLFFYIYKSLWFIDLPHVNSIFLSFSVPLTTCTLLNRWSKQHLNKVNNDTERIISVFFFACFIGIHSDWIVIEIVAKKWNWKDFWMWCSGEYLR